MPFASDEVTLHGFWRSTASWRVRIALNLKGVAYEQVAYHLRKGEQRSTMFLALNPQGLVPALEIGGAILTQSLAICEYLDETFPDPPLLAAHPLERARIRAFAQVIACDIHPVQNLKVLQRLAARGLNEAAVQEWARDVIVDGLDACEHLLPSDERPFCFGETPSLADICLVPQLANARRFGAVMRWPGLERIESNCQKLHAFSEALPICQPDAEEQ